MRARTRRARRIGLTLCALSVAALVTGAAFGYAAVWANGDLREKLGWSALLSLIVAFLVGLQGYIIVDESERW